MCKPACERNGVFFSKNLLKIEICAVSEIAIADKTKFFLLLNSTELTMCQFFYLNIEIISFSNGIKWHRPNILKL